MSDLPVSTATVTAFLLVLSRTGAWVITAPVLSARGMSSVGRLAAAVALAVFVTPLIPHSQVPGDLAPYLGAVVGQVAIGLALGFLTNLLFTAFDVAGSLVDLTGGFSYAAIVDPLSGQPAALFSRLFVMCFSALFFVTNAHLTVVGGFVTSFRALPVDHVPSLTSGAATVLGHAVTQVLLSAFQVAAPLLGVLFLTDVALGLAARFVPQANALQLALPVKTLVALTMAGASLALLPHALSSLVGNAHDLPAGVVR
jgi:flagellar biosynthetic protein FliR